MPEGAKQGQEEKIPTTKLVYVGNMLGLEIAESGQYAEFGKPIEVPNRETVRRHMLDEHGRYKDVRYPGLADQLLTRPDFIEASAVKKEIEAAAARARAIDAADTGRQVLALEAAERGERIDEVVWGEPGYQVVEPGTPLPGPGAEQAPTEPTVVPQGAQADVQPNPPVNLQPSVPGQQTAEPPGDDVKEDDKQAQPGRARSRRGNASATRRG